MSRGRPSARSIALARVVLDEMRRHVSSDVDLARVLEIPQPAPSRARRLGLTPATARKWAARWTAAGYPPIAVSVVVDIAGERHEL